MNRTPVRYMKSTSDTPVADSSQREAMIISTRDLTSSPRQHRSWPRDLLITCALLALSFYLYSHWIWRPASPDERDYLGWGMKIYKERVYEKVDGKPVTAVPPLHPYALALGFRVFGPSIDVAQAMSLVFGCACIGLAYGLGRSLWNWRVGLIAALVLLTAAKGEFWRYSNRVLSDIHLTFFVLVTLFGLCLYWRRGRWWMGVVAGVGLGLGLLTKELILLIFPVFVGVFVLRRGNMGTKLISLVAVLALVGLLVLPWVVHVRSLDRYPWARGGKERAVKALGSERAWGLRPADELWRMIRFYDRPAWVTQVLFLGAILYGGWRCRREGEGEEAILIAAALVWFGAFAVFKPLPLNLRRLIPLLPIFSLLVAVLFDDIWLSARGLSRRLGDRKGWARAVLLAAFLVFVANNLKPVKLFEGFEPLTVLHSKREPFLEKAVHGALACIPEGAPVVTNYESLLYFYTRGRYPVRGLHMTTAKRIRFWMRKDPNAERPRQVHPVIYDFVHKRRRMVMDEPSLLAQFQDSKGSYLIFFRTGHPKQSPPALDRYFLDHPERFSLICSKRAYAIYRILL